MILYIHVMNMIIFTNGYADQRMSTNPHDPVLIDSHPNGESSKSKPHLLVK